MNSFWNNIFLGNTVRDWAIAFAIISGLFIFLWVIKSIVVIWIKRAAKRTKTTVDDFLILVIEKYVLPFFYLLSVYFALSYLTFGPRSEQVIKTAMLIAGTYFVVSLITSLIAYLITSYVETRDGADVKKKQVRGIIIISKVFVWIAGIVFLIDNFGYDITTIITGLGIGGIAIALAAQVILKDLFSYFVIYFDKPFEIGDFIVVDDKSGTVEYIGIKTTRIRSLGGEQLIMSNTDLTDSRVQNYKRLEQRRIAYSIRVSNKTPEEKLKKIPGMIKSIIQSQELLKFDRAHFSMFAESYFNFEYVYFVLSADYNMYMDKQQEINLAIVASFRAEQIEFAYPAQQVYISSSPSTAL